MAKVIKKVFCAELKGKPRFRRLLGEPFRSKGLRSGLVTLKPSEAVGEHKTVNKEEVIIVLKGKALIYYGKNKKIKTPQGSFVYIPPDTLHNVKNPGNKILQYVYVTAECV